MKIGYDEKFKKDILKLKNKELYDKIKTFISKVKNAENLLELTNIKKIKANDNAYRWKTGDYRLGFIYDGEVVILMRFLHRKEIYERFP